MDNLLTKMNPFEYVEETRKLQEKRQNKLMEQAECIGDNNTIEPDNIIRGKVICALMDVFDDSYFPDRETINRLCELYKPFMESDPHLNCINPDTIHTFLDNLTNETNQMLREEKVAAEAVVAIDNRITDQLEDNNAELRKKVKLYKIQRSFSICMSVATFISFLVASVLIWRKKK